MKHNNHKTANGMGGGEHDPAQNGEEVLKLSYLYHGFDSLCVHLLCPFLNLNGKTSVNILI